MRIKRVLLDALKALALGLASIATFHPVVVAVFEQSKRA
jgi:hypothetical protein